MRALLVPTALVLAAFSIVACDEAPTAVEESAGGPTPVRSRLWRVMEDRGLRPADTST